jgi:flagellar basal-body rod protein FlgB
MTSLNIDATLNPMSAMLRGLGEKQQLIASNLANANTPGYLAKSASFSDIMATLNHPFETRLSAKMGSMLPAEFKYGAEGPVNIQHEFVDMQKNLMHYNMTTRRLSTIFSTIRTATQIGR